LKELVALHINITQASSVGVGEANVFTMTATIQASVMGTDYEDTFNLKNAWEDIRRLHADVLSLRYLMELVQIATNLKTHQEDFAVSK
jgi:hypothetical protein